MKTTSLSEAQNRQQSARNVVEEALDIVIQNAALDSDMIKAMRLTCKSTKAAADRRVRKFEMSLHQKPEAVQRSGLLDYITTLSIEFEAMSSGEDINHPLEIARAVGLLNLAVEVCSNSLQALEVGISGSPEIIYTCASILGSPTWTCLETIFMQRFYPMPGFLSHVLVAQPGSLPALKELHCQDPSAADIESLCNEAFVENLAALYIHWSSRYYASNVAPPTIDAMRILLQKATNLERLSIESSTFDFFDCEQLVSLKSLYLTAPTPVAQRGLVDIAPALARPWSTLETLHIQNASLEDPELLRIFEAEDTLPVLKELVFINSRFTMDALSCVCRPHLESFHLSQCSTGHRLLFHLAEIMKDGRHALPSLRQLSIMCRTDDPPTRRVLSKFLSCPSMVALEKVTLFNLDIGVKGSRLLYHLANCCPKLKELDLRYNNLYRSSVALFAGYGAMGAWPELEILWGISDEQIDEDDYDSSEDEDPYSIFIEEDEDEESRVDHISMVPQHSFMPRLDVQTTLRRFWPGLICY